MDIILMSTNAFKKNLKNTKRQNKIYLELSITLNCLANSNCQEIYEFLFLDIIDMLGSSNSLIRKKAYIVINKAYYSDPELIDRTF